MKTTVLMAMAVLASSTATAQTDEWDATDKALAGIALALTVVDMGQTITIAKDCHNSGTHYYETNSILGNCPSVGRVKGYFVSSILLSGAIADVLPSKYRKDFLASAAAVEFRMAYHNFSANVYWSWK